MPYLWFLCSPSLLLLLFIFARLLENLWNHFQVIDRAQLYDWDHFLHCPKGSNSKSRYSKLWFLCSAQHIMVIYSCMKYQKNKKYLKQFSSYRADTEITIFNVQRAITSKVGYGCHGSCVLHIIPRCFTFVRNFIKISETGSSLQSWHEYMVEMAIFNIYYLFKGW